MRKPALLVLQDGSVLRGESIGVDGQAVGEVVFNTAMTGYQEVLTDPSYRRQIVSFTYPHIGNVGCNAEDEESAGVMASGLVIRDLPLMASNWRSEKTLEGCLLEAGLVAIAGVDTRRLTRILRQSGAQSGCIVAGESPDAEAALKAARGFPGLAGLDLAREVTTLQPYSWRQGSWSLEGGLPEASENLARFRVTALDFGVKRNILRMLADRGCDLTVVPAQTTASRVLAQSPDGVFLSNGPGDPGPCGYAIESIREIVDAGVPVFGICLGYQLLSLASGARTVKMKFGHHGANHPVQDLADGRVMISSQNHGFAVDEQALPEHLRATHRSLFDGTLQGVHRVDRPAFGFQGHPEASPGPHDVAPLFDHFIDLMQERADTLS